MISARGAQCTRTVLAEVAALKARGPCGGVLLTLPDFERAWNAAARVLRAQLMLGASIIVSPKAMTFFQTRKVVAVDGNTRYSLRENHAGFSVGFVTTYSLDATVPREDPKVTAMRLPLDLVAAEARLSIEAVSDALREVFLYVGESLFQGKLIELTFPGVATVLVKRDRAVTKFDQGFLDEMFAIDSRKWPQAVRDLASATRSRPVHRSDVAPTSARPSSAPSRPASAPSTRGSSAGRPAAAIPAQAAAAPTDRPCFLSASAKGATFDDIAHRLQQRQLLLSKRQKPAASLKTKGAPLKPAAMDTTALGGGVETAQPTVIIAPVAPGEEEESVYSMLTPGRDRDVAAVSTTCAAAPASQREDAATDSTVHDDAVVSVPTVPSAQPLSRALNSRFAPRHVTDIFNCLDNVQPERRTGRKGYVTTANEGKGVRELLFWDATTGKEQRRPKLHDNFVV